MTTVAPKRGPDQPAADPGDRLGVVKAALLAASSFATAVSTMLCVVGAWGTPPDLAKFAIAVVGIIAALALGIAAVYVWRK